MNSQELSEFKAEVQKLVENQWTATVNTTSTFSPNRVMEVIEDYEKCWALLLDSREADLSRIEKNLVRNQENVQGADPSQVEVMQGEIEALQTLLDQEKQKNAKLRAELETYTMAPSVKAVEKPRGRPRKR